MGQASWGIRGNLAFLLSLALSVQILLSLMKASVASFTLLGSLAEWTTFTLSPSMGAHFKIYLAVNHSRNLICTKHVKTLGGSLFQINDEQCNNYLHCIYTALDSLSHTGLILRVGRV